MGCGDWKVSEETREDEWFRPTCLFQGKYASRDVLFSFLLLTWLRMWGGTAILSVWKEANATLSNFLTSNIKIFGKITKKLQILKII